MKLVVIIQIFILSVLSATPNDAWKKEAAEAAKKVAAKAVKVGVEKFKSIDPEEARKSVEIALNKFEQKVAENQEILQPTAKAYVETKKKFQEALAEKPKLAAFLAEISAFGKITIEAGKSFAEVAKDAIGRALLEEGSEAIKKADKVISQTDSVPPTTIESSKTPKADKYKAKLESSLKKVERFFQNNSRRSRAAAKMLRKVQEEIKKYLDEHPEVKQTLSKASALAELGVESGKRVNEVFKNAIGTALEKETAEATKNVEQHVSEAKAQAKAEKN